MSPSASRPSHGVVQPDLPDQFSLAQGGLLFEVLRRLRLSDAVLSEARPRVIAMVSLAWLPLLLLATLDGLMLGGRVDVRFLLDVEAHLRFLVAAPLLILAEVAVHRRLPPLLQQFLVRNLVPPASMDRFRAAVASAFRLRNSLLAEALILALVYGVGVMIVWRHFEVLDAATWYATPTAAGPKLTLAGFWYGYVSVPIVQFLLLRWYWRMLIWARLLWQISRVELRLVPAHPDRYGGLGFLSTTGYVFTMFAAAHGVLMAGPIASRIFFAGATLTDFGSQISGLLLFLLCVVLGPSLFFMPQLAAAKQAALLEHGALAERYVRGFGAKWLRTGDGAGEALLGTADIQSQADLGSIYEVVRTMNITPVSIGAVAPIAAATLAPFVPLALTMVPLNELLKSLLGIAL
jgi:hypothetical protein